MKLNVVKFVFVVSIYIFSSSQLYSQNKSVLSALEDEIINLVDKVKPSVVTVSASYDITITESTKSTHRNSPQKTKRTVELNNIGSGIIIDSTHIITRASVVHGSKKIKVQLYDKNEVPAEFIGEDPDFGIAVIRVSKKGLVPAPIAKKDKLSAGCWVTIIGNSLGIAPSVSLGVVNGIRTDGIIQLSTNIAAGSVGGPIFDTTGNMVGILAAKLSTVQDSNLLKTSMLSDAGALAFPAHVIVEQAKEIIAHESSPRAWLGVEAIDLSDDPASVQISSVKQNSPAEKVGLEKGDIVKKVDDQRVRNARHLATYIRYRKPGQEIEMQILRDSTLHGIKVSLAEPVQNRPSTPLQSTSLKFNGNDYQNSKIDNDMLLQRIQEIEREITDIRSHLK